MLPHRWQPTRLCRPWHSPGKNTGVSCHFLLQCMEVKSESEVAQSCLIPREPMDCSLPGSSVHGICQARVLEWVAIAFSKREYSGRLKKKKLVPNAYKPCIWTLPVLNLTPCFIEIPKITAKTKVKVFFLLFVYKCLKAFKVVFEKRFWFFQVLLICRFS